MDEEHIVRTDIPHSDLGDPECCGCFNFFIRGETVEIVCNECNLMVRTVPVADLQKTLTEMELALPVAVAVCPHCEQ